MNKLIALNAHEVAIVSGGMENPASIGFYVAGGVAALLGVLSCVKGCCSSSVPDGYFRTYTLLGGDTFVQSGVIPRLSPRAKWMVIGFFTLWALTPLLFVGGWLLGDKNKN